MTRFSFTNRDRVPNFSGCLCLSLLFASIFLFYPQIASLKGSLLTGDHKTQHYPWACFLDQALSRGDLPWWTWKIHCGFPLLAEGQIGGFYPPNLLLHFLLPENLAYSLNFLLHLFLSGTFFILYCRRMQLSWPSSVVAALAFLYGNAFGGAYYNFTSLKTLCWFPLSLYLIDRLMDTRRRAFGVFLGVVFGMQLLAGYLQLAVYGIGMSMLYFVLRFFLRDRSSTAGPEKGAPRSAAGAWTGLSIAMAVTTLIFLPQFLATYPLSQMSGRIGLSESFAYIGSFPPWGMLTLVLPRMQAMLLTLGLYVGILPIFLVFLSLGTWSQYPVRRWWIMLGIALLLAMGGYSPLYVALVKITGFYGFRVPSKLLFFANTALAVLAGWGMEAWLRGAVSSGAWKKAKSLFLVLTAGTVLLVIAGGALLDAFRVEILNWGYDYVQRNIYGKPYHSHSLEFYRSGVESYFEMMQNLLRLNNPALYVSLITAISTVLAAAFFRRSWRKGMISAVCIGLVACDLYAYHFISKMAGDVSTFVKQTQPPPSVVFLQKDKSLYRILGYPSRGQELSLCPSYNILFGIEDIGAYSPFATKRYGDLLEGLGAVDDSTGWHAEKPDQAMRKLPLLSAMNVKYILAGKNQNLPGLEEVFSSNTERIYRNPDVQDRFFFAQKVAIQKDPAVLLDEVRAMDFSDLRTVWLEEEIPEPHAMESGGNIHIEEYGEGHIALYVESAQDGLLFGSLLHYPGITASVDGVAANIYRANYCFCAISVPKGRHRVEFVFDWKKSLGFPLLKKLYAFSN